MTSLKKTEEKNSEMCAFIKFIYLPIYAPYFVHFYFVYWQFLWMHRRPKKIGLIDSLLRLKEKICFSSAQNIFASKKTLNSKTEYAYLLFLYACKNVINKMPRFFSVT